MGVIWAKFRREKSTQQVLEALQEKIDTLETFTVNTQEQKKRIVGNFLAVSIGVYVIAFVVFYFLYFPPTWRERIVYFIPLLLFPIIIYFLRYFFNWYYQRKLNKNSKKLTALRAEKKKILEQVMDKETYKVAVNLLARFADKPSKTAVALSSTTTPSKYTQPLLKRISPPSSNLNQSSKQLTLASTPSARPPSSYLNAANTPSLTTNLMAKTFSPTTGLMTPNSPANQQLRRRTPFPIVNQQDKGVFDRIVDVLIGDGPQDRFAMICKECFSHNGMALKEDFEYTTFRCAFCNVLNPARKTRPVAPRLSVMPASNLATRADSDTSDTEDDKDDSDDEPVVNPKINDTVFSSQITNISSLTAKNEMSASVAATAAASSTSSDTDEEKPETKTQPLSGELKDESKNIEKSESAIGDIKSPE